MGAQPPPWISKIFGFQGVFRSQRVPIPLGKENNESTPQDRILSMVLDASIHFINYSCLYFVGGNFGDIGNILDFGNIGQ